MLLKNFIIAQGAALFGKSATATGLSVVNTAGTVEASKNIANSTIIIEEGAEADKNRLYGFLPTIYNTPGTSTGSYDMTIVLGVVLGTGTNPVTFNDYCLQSPVWLDFVSHSMNAGTGSGSITDVWQNNTAEAVTINEIGLVCMRGNAGSSSMSISANYSRVIQLSRTVLGTPIVLAPSEQRAFTITLNMNALDTVAVNV